MGGFSTCLHGSAHGKKEELDWIIGRMFRDKDREGKDADEIFKAQRTNGKKSVLWTRVWMEVTIVQVYSGLFK